MLTWRWLAPARTGAGLLNRPLITGKAAAAKPLFRG
jgi:hypothetical protein